MFPLSARHSLRIAIVMFAACPIVVLAASPAKHLERPADGFQIDQPADWDLTDVSHMSSGDKETRFTFKPQSNATTRFDHPSAIILRIAPAPRERTPTEIRNLFMGGSVAQSADFTHLEWYNASLSNIESGSGVLWGHPALVYRFTSDFRGKYYQFTTIQASFDMKDYELFLRSAPENWTSDLQIYKAVIDSFKPMADQTSSSSSSMPLSVQRALSKSSNPALKPAVILPKKVNAAHEIRRGR